NGSLVLANCTVVANLVTQGTDTNGGTDGRAAGGAVYNLALGVGGVTPTTIALLTLANGILAGSTGGKDLVNDEQTGVAGVNATGPNVVTAVASNVSLVGTPFTGGNPKLGLLADNGGP